ncbi:MAG TPA: phosphatidate cytidylyltransferase [Candidatus Acidoferrum sp.]|nr:phosphatidate cytidylyltransferase [Candidatus Acidoferrum sp.]
MTWKRVATAAVLIPLVVGLVVQASTGVVALAVALVMLLALFEFFALGDAIGHRAYRFWTATCAIMLVYVQWLAAAEPLRQLGPGIIVRGGFGRFYGTLPTVTDVFFLFVLGVAALTLWTRRPLVEALPAAGISSGGLLLVAFPLSFAVRLHGLADLGPWLLLFSLVIVWVGDSAAYFVGRSIGRHSLAPHLSPKKTWEGTIASLLGSLAVGLVFSRWVNIPLPQLLGMAAAGNLFGQTGDLLESAYKRSAGVKDSGAILPGHGGILDRIDALILAIPVVWYYWIWICSPRT